MLHCLIICYLLLSILLTSCSAPSSAQLNTTLNAQLPQSNTKGQYLPVSAQMTIANGKKIDLEVAKTPEQQMMGLMYRPALPDNRGMLFAFPSPQPVGFWMKNVPVSLDMVFINRGVVQYIKTAPPCKNEPCPTYGPRVLIDQVVELRAERARELGLKIGDRVKIEVFKPLR